MQKKIIYFFFKNIIFLLILLLHKHGKIIGLMKNILRNKNFRMKIIIDYFYERYEVIII